MAREVLLDVHELEPPEPLVLTLEAAEKLQAGEYLHMLHRRDPCLLYAKLDQLGCRYRNRNGVLVELYIWRDGDKEAENAVSNICPDTEL